ncbi:hypothetical protein KP509_17G031500 [Ceratopteris richardii]|uniref:Uncharacterized protein n=1 Tax=Ceratopteris richardii TaxID=49495 RepID=A0A8T2STY5_CERRI|nr:hypothetical protein KP509_17G031500 [Ceratopteris richardii]KAH7372972.1 hypothetical protein KP509_17G031500 [Ceratopteris richardii]
MFLAPMRFRLCLSKELLLIISGKSEQSSPYEGRLANQQASSVVMLFTNQQMDADEKQKVRRADD